ncbi:hypothetical protein [Breznakiella homolactica]|uniref:Uncharacterized protein n=1 Tax=Breznakiella homolactica TaxID=2798577 RepID=A0A7T7XPX7_9SPIR|nr:hypothetical protein [Breznakiella homolactica]QQO10331.1 hypothetical protein JFL75_05270 [Breznakiella homolactica]
MFKCSPRVTEAIPMEYRDIAEKLFPLNGYASGEGPAVESSVNFAEILGIGADYNRLLNSGKRPADMSNFMEHFQNNLDLLIQKTWVEKADEEKKERLQDRIPEFIGEITREEYREALADFGIILEELAYLLFGAQSHKEDFTEYTLRIDTQMGLFWWYGGKLGTLSDFSDRESLRALLLIGICYLTNF